uniref:RNA helicase n=1 Tax=Neobenedenia girellae TaxID=280698 RepID=A1IIT4_9PLAT|nr:RNA helicase [Neobenedenia girellae]
MIKLLKSSAIFLNKYSKFTIIAAKYSRFHSKLGVFPPHIWNKQRPADQYLEKLLFHNNNVNKSTADADSQIVSLCGLPVSPNFIYDLPENVDELQNFDQKLVENLHLNNIVKFSSVQKHCIGLMSVEETLSSGVDLDYKMRIGKYDLMASSQTGSGKTLAYVLPIVNRILNSYPKLAMNTLAKSDLNIQCPSALVLVPTRELVQQILLEFNKMLYRCFPRAVGVYGGQNRSRQIHELSKGCHFMIATPGRLIDFLDEGMLRMDHCHSVVLDEADRMLDMGFEHQIRKILSNPDYGMPQPSGDGLPRQTVLFSATFPPSVLQIGRSFLRGNRCISFSVKQSEDDPVVPAWGEALAPTHGSKKIIGQIPEKIVQKMKIVEKFDWKSEVQKILNELLQDKDEDESILVFCNTKRMVELLEFHLYKSGLKCGRLHGGMGQTNRDRSLRLLRDGRINVLVATSVAARGLDIPAIGAVVNVGLPTNLDDYIHRVGRTGRFGQCGLALTCVFSDSIHGQRELIHDIRQVAGKYAQDFPTELTAPKQSRRRAILLK